MYTYCLSPEVYVHETHPLQIRSVSTRSSELKSAIHLISKRTLEKDWTYKYSHHNTTVSVEHLPTPLHSTTMTKLLVIIGITGLQGSSVHKVFQNEPGWRIRGITRNPSKHPDLQTQGVDLVSANLDDPASLESAFKDAHAIFAVTDFWQFLKEASTFATAEREGKKPNQVAMEREIQQGRNMVHAAAKQLATLERLVFSTLSDSRKWSNGEIKWNLHFDGKAMITEYLQQNFPDLAQRTSYLHMGSYLSNWRMNARFAPQKQPDGSFVIRRFALANGKPLPYVNPPNDTGHFVRALVLSPSAPPGSAMLGGCELLTNEELCALWGKVHGVECRFEVLTYDHAIEAGMPEWMALEVSESGTYTTKFGWAGGDPEVKSPGELGVDVGKLTSVEEWIRREDWRSVL